MELHAILGQIYLGVGANVDKHQLSYHHPVLLPTAHRLNEDPATHFREGRLRLATACECKDMIPKR